MFSSSCTARAGVAAAVTVPGRRSHLKSARLSATSITSARHQHARSRSESTISLTRRSPAQRRVATASALFNTPVATPAVGALVEVGGWEASLVKLARASLRLHGFSHSQNPRHVFRWPCWIRRKWYLRQSFRRASYRLQHLSPFTIFLGTFVSYGASPRTPLAQTRAFFQPGAVDFLNSFFLYLMRGTTQPRTLSLPSIPSLLDPHRSRARACHSAQASSWTHCDPSSSTLAQISALFW